MSEKALSPDSIKIMAENVAFVSFDVIQFRENEMRSHWYRYKDIDLYYFQNQDGEIAKIHVSIFGQVVEWNKYDGLRTGLLREQEGPAGVSEVVQYDARTSSHSVQQALDVLALASKMSPSQREQLSNCLKGKTSYKQSFWKKFLSKFF